MAPTGTDLRVMPRSEHNYITSEKHAAHIVPPPLRLLANSISLRQLWPQTC